MSEAMKTFRNAREKLMDNVRDDFLAKFNAIPHAKGTKEYSADFERITHEYADALQTIKNS